MANEPSTMVLAASNRRDWLNSLRPTLCGNPEVGLFEVCTPDISSLLEGFEAIRPQIVVLDHGTTNSSTATWLAAIRKVDPDVDILMVCDDSYLDRCDEVFDYSVKGCISQEGGAGLVARAVAAVSRGELWLPRQALERRLSVLEERLERQATASGMGDELDASLTERERAIAESVSRGLTNKQIGREMAISGETVKTHLSNIFIKLNIRRRSELAALLAGQQDGLSGPDSTN